MGHLLAEWKDGWQTCEGFAESFLLRRLLGIHRGSHYLYEAKMERFRYNKNSGVTACPIGGWFPRGRSKIK